MKIAILTIFPDMFVSPLSVSILGRARDEGLLTVDTVDIRPYSAMKHKNTDDYPFGGGAGRFSDISISLLAPDTVLVGDVAQDAQLAALAEMFAGKAEIIRL